MNKVEKQDTGLRVACSTSFCGSSILNVEQILDLIQASPFKGVEIAQSPESIFRVHADGERKPLTSVELRKLLKERDLSLAGFTRGEPSEISKFCGELLEPDYIRSFEGQSFDGIVNPAMEYSPHQSGAQGIPWIVNLVRLSFLGEDLIRAVDENINTTIAIQFSDWSRGTPSFTYQDYRGCVDLGEGEIPLKSLLDRIEQASFKGWVVWRDNRPKLGSKKAIDAASRWLIQNRFGETGKLSVPTRSYRRGVERREKLRGYSRFLRELLRVANEPEKIEKVAQLIKGLLRSNSVTVWNVTSISGRLTCQSSANPGDPFPPLSIGSRAARMAVGSRVPCRFAADDSRDMVLHQGPGHSLSIPILNPWNSDEVVLVFNCYFFQTPELPSNQSIQQISEDIASVVFLESDSPQVASTLAHSFASVESGEHSAAKLSERVARLVGCGEVGIFTRHRNRFQLLSDFRLDEGKREKTYTYSLEDSGLLGVVWEHPRPMIVGGDHWISGRELANDSVGSTAERAEDTLLYPVVCKGGGIRAIAVCRKMIGDRPVCETHIQTLSRSAELVGSALELSRKLRTRYFMGYDGNYHLLCHSLLNYAKANMPSRDRGELPIERYRTFLDGLRRQTKYRFWLFDYQLGAAVEPKVEAKVIDLKRDALAPIIGWYEFVDSYSFAYSKRLEINFRGEKSMSIRADGDLLQMMIHCLLELIVQGSDFSRPIKIDIDCLETIAGVDLIIRTNARLDSLGRDDGSFLSEQEDWAFYGDLGLRTLLRSLISMNDAKIKVRSKEQRLDLVVTLKKANR